MTEKNPTQDTMDKIMSGEVRQVPRWHFIVKNIILWIVGFLCIVAGALTVSLIIFTFANGAFSLRGVAYHNFIQHIMIVLPILWIIITIIFVALFDFFVRCTRRGYRYSLWVVIGANILLSIVLGTVFYFLGISHVVDDMLGGHFRSYHSVERRQSQLFNKPDEGMVIGRTISCQDDHFTLVTSDGEKWHIMSKNIPEFKQKIITDGRRFVVIGKKIDDNIFVACDIRRRGMAGGSGQIRRKHMDKVQEIDCDGEKTCVHHIEKMPTNIENAIQSACAQIQAQ